MRGLAHFEGCVAGNCRRILVSLLLTLPSLLIGAAPRSAVEQRAEVAWLESVSLEIRSLETGAPTDDLAPMTGRLEDAEVIGLGDGSHGTKEFYSIKHRLIEHLVREAGVRTVVFEGPWPEFNRINAYIQGAEGNPFDDLRSQWWFWNTREIVELIEWAREWNTSSPDSERIEFRGVDMAIPTSLFEDVFQHLNERDPVLAADVNTRLACFREFRRYSERSDADKSACQRNLQGVVRLLERNDSRESATRSWEVVRSAEMIVEAEALYRGSSRYDYSTRDALMAGQITKLREDRPAAAPIVYWAHNGHVGASKIPFHRNQRSTGSYLAERFGDGYYSIGSITAEGAFLVWDERADHPIRRLHFPVPAEASYEYLFAQSSLDSFIALLSERGGSELITPRSLSFGMGGASVQQAVVDIREMFDAVIFIRHTTPTDYLGAR